MILEILFSSVVEQRLCEKRRLEKDLEFVYWRNGVGVFMERERERDSVGLVRPYFINETYTVE